MAPQIIMPPTPPHQVQHTAPSSATNSRFGSSQVGKSAFDWDVYKNRRTALQHLKRNLTLVDTILESEDGSAYELVHSQVISALGDKLTQYINNNGTYVDRYRSIIFRTSRQEALTDNSRPATKMVSDTTNATNISSTLIQSGTAGRSINCFVPKQPLWSKWPGRVKLIRLPRVNRYTLSIIVGCAYTGFIHADVSSGGIWEVLDMADYYEMVEIIRCCCNFLAQNLTRYNCVYFYHVGIKHNETLRCSAFHTIRANFKWILAQNLKLLRDEENLQNVPRSPLDRATLNAQVQLEQQMSANSSSSAFNRCIAYVSASAQERRHSIGWEMFHNLLATIRYEDFESLLKHDKLNVDNEESVWFAIRLWCNYNLAERAPRLAGLLPCMRFPRFRTATEFSARHIWRDPLVMNNKEAQHQLAVLDRNHRDFLTGVAYATARDGYMLPCAANPRQLRPRVPHAILLAIGGWQQGQPTRLIESYDANCNLWYESKKRIMTPLAYHGIECINGLLYICGGTDGNEILSEVFTFDPVRGECSQKPSMRESRCYVSTAFLGGKLYAMGGHNGQQRVKSVERYDLVGEAWENVRSMNVARSDASACVYNQKVYIAGGLNDQIIESSVEFYDGGDNTWTFIESMITPRTSFSLLLLGDKLLAIGGNNGSERLSSVEQYNFSNRSWSHHSNMRHRRSTFSAALLEERKLVVVGGYNGQTPFNQVEMYDEDEGNWSLLHKIRFDRSGLKVVAVNDLPNAIEYTFLGSSSSIGYTNAYDVH